MTATPDQIAEAVMDEIEKSRMISKTRLSDAIRNVMVRYETVKPLVASDASSKDIADAYRRLSEEIRNSDFKVTL